MVIPRESSLAVNDPVLQSLGLMGATSATSGWQMPKIPRMAFSPGFVNGVRGAARVGGRVALPLTAVLALADAAGELSDPNEPASRNLSEAGGQLSGNLFGGVGGAGLALALGAGTLSGPFAPLVIPAAAAAGAWLGGGPGKDIAAGVHDLITGYKPKTEDDIKRENYIKNQEAMATAALAKRKGMLPVSRDEALMLFEADKMRAELDLRLKNDYNYAQTLNAQMLQGQQSAALQHLALTQALMS